jgi:hypothetical protein
VIFWDLSSRTRRFLRVVGEMFERESFRLTVWTAFDGEEDMATIVQVSLTTGVSKRLLLLLDVDVDVEDMFGMVSVVVGREAYDGSKWTCLTRLKVSTASI